MRCWKFTKTRPLRHARSAAGGPAAQRPAAARREAALSRQAQRLGILTPGLTAQYQTAQTQRDGWLLFGLTPGEIRSAVERLAQIVLSPAPTMPTGVARSGAFPPPAAVIAHRRPMHAVPVAAGVRYRQAVQMPAARCR